MTDHAADCAYDLDLDLDLDDWDIAAILEGGVDCEEGPRSANKRERCAKLRRQEFRVIVALEPSRWVEDELAWVVLSVKPVTRK